MNGLRLINMLPVVIMAIELSSRLDMMKLSVLLKSLNLGDLFGVQEYGTVRAFVAST